MRKIWNTVLRSLVLFGLVVWIDAGRCYSCNNKWGKCSSEGFTSSAGIKTIGCNSDVCFVEQRQDGFVYRGCAASFPRMADKEPGYCYTNGQYKFCLCDQDRCNDFNFDAFYANGSCPVPYTHDFDNSCYVASQDNDISYQGMNAFCEDIDGYLLRINSQEEADFIFNMTVDLGISSDIHIGINDLFDNGALRYTGNRNKPGRLLTADDYISPNLETGWDTYNGCFILARSYSDDVWRDTNCDVLHYGICEFDNVRPF